MARPKQKPRRRERDFGRPALTTKSLAGGAPPEWRRPHVRNAMPRPRRASARRDPDAAEVSQVADDLREQYTPRARTRHPVPTQAGGRAMIRTATLAALAALLTAPAMAACPAITSDTDPCWAAQVIQSEKGRPAAADEWTPESFARTFDQTIASLTDAGQSVLHHCNPTFCEDVITDGKIVAYRDTGAGKPDLSSVCYAVQGSPEIRKCLYNSGEKNP